MEGVRAHLGAAWAAERQRVFLWVPVLFGAGSGLYLTLPAEPIGWIAPGRCRALRTGSSAAAPAHGGGPRARGAGPARRRCRRRRLALGPGQRAGARQAHRPGRRVRARGLGRRRRRAAALPPGPRAHRGPGSGGDARAGANQRPRRGSRWPGRAGIVAHGAHVAPPAAGPGRTWGMGLRAAGVVPANRRRRLRLRRA